VSFASWHDFYDSAWQGLWALWAAPFAFLVWRALAATPASAGAVPAAKHFVVTWSWIFVFQTMLDPVATGPIAKAIGTPAAGTSLGLSFVLLGDFRIWWLVFGVERRAGALARAFVPTAGIPVVAWLVTAALAPLPDQVLYLVHETLFVAVAFWMSRRVAGRFERDVLAYAGVYYGLWAAADVLILAGVDSGWLLRCVPNQLYYGATVPFVWWRFFAPSYAAASAPTQASR
jgi:hypothetical protein